MTEQTQHVSQRTQGVVELPDAALGAAIGGYAGTHALYQDIVIPANASASSTSYYGTGIYRSLDSGRSW